MNAAHSSAVTSLRTAGAANASYPSKAAPASETHTLSKSSNPRRRAPKDARLARSKRPRLEALGGYPRGLGLELLQHTLRSLTLSAEDDRSGTGGEIDLVVKVAAEQTLGVKPE